ncbi:MAG: DNA repair protein RecN [Clostridia bacterium]|nr:DNA repair protein RecN [Clostridia bacterium]
MFTSLHIENIAVIESADISFSAGLNVLTGETGAGKSIIIDAINMITGGRTSRDSIRTGCKKAYVSASFENLDASLLDIAAGLGIDIEDGELIISREINSDGRSTARANGRQITVSMLRELGKNLINIHGQHDNIALSDPSTHLSYLDSFAKNDAERNAYSEKYTKVKSIVKQIDSLSVNEREKAMRTDILRYQINELEAARLTAGEEEILEKRRLSLANREKVINGFYAAKEALCGGETNARDLASAALGELNYIARFDEDAAALSERMNDVFAELDDISDEVSRFADGIDDDISELDSVEARLDTIRSFRRKYGNTVAEMLEFLDKAKEELENIEFSDEKIKALQKELAAAKQELDKVSASLSLSRKRAAERLEKAITDELVFLDMPNVRFAVDIKEKQQEKDGADGVEFLISANIGEDLKPLSSIASGGELSRIMLAVKNVLPKNGAGTLVFDEIDTGVSGRAAQKIAVKLKQMSSSGQVAVVTHLAQIAAKGDAHFVISKESRNDRTYTKVTPVSGEDRIKELARIMGGDSITPALLQTAREMLDL